MTPSTCLNLVLQLPKLPDPRPDEVCMYTVQEVTS